jgi:hypothetical protein
MKIRSIIIIVIFSLFTVSAFSSDKGFYRIVKDHKRPNIKRSVDVRINQRLTVEQLESIAFQIKESDYNSYKRTFILYYLPGQVIDSGAWASTHFNPTLDIQIFELSLSEYENLIKSAIKIKKQYLIGQWYESLGTLSRVVTLYKKGSKVIMHYQYKDGSKGNKEVTISPTNNGLKFEETKGNSFGEFYLINKDKYLESWDSDGIIGKYPPLN